MSGKRKRNRKRVMGPRSLRGRNGIRHAVSDVVRFAARSEFMTPAGLLNLVGMCFAVIGSGLLGLSGVIEPIVRIKMKSYRSGVSVLALLVVLVLYFLACVVVVGLLDRSRGRK